MRAALLAALILYAPAAAAFERETDVVFADKAVALAAPAPETAIDTPDGPVTLADWRGKVAVVTIWATWCEVCEVEMPIIDALAEAYEGRGVVFLPVSVDEAPALRKVADHFAMSLLDNLPVMVDRDHALALRIGVRGTPTSLVIDRFGQIVAAFEGQGPWADPATAAYLAALVAAPDPAASAQAIEPFLKR